MKPVGATARELRRTLRRWARAAAFCAAGVALPASAQDLGQLERDTETARAEMDRIGAQYSVVPELFGVSDRDDRAIWGSIYHLNKEYNRASLALFGAVEPRPGEDLAQLQQNPSYAESLFHLADSLYELGNVGAARQYFERLLALRGHGFHDDAILRLMAMADVDGRFDDVDRYYADYQKIAGQNVPGQVRYLHGKSLFRAGRLEGALQELGQIPTGDAYDLRARYLRGAVLTKTGKLNEALAVFDDVVRLRGVAKEDADVRQLGHLGRGRLLYELDRLDESIDAYQEIDYDSPFLTDMLYEVTLTYVRRGQLALRPVKGDKKTDAERRAAAKQEYKKALRQLDDLRALDPDGERSADIELLAGNLLLQRLEFDDAEDTFVDLLEKYRNADNELARLISDTSLRESVLKDLLALESDKRAVLSSPLPPLAAKRASRQRDVAASLEVFKEIQRSRADVDASRRMLDELDAQLAPENPGRAELFSPLRSAVERSLALANTTTSLKSRATQLERKLARPSAEQRTALDAAAARRKELEDQVASLPRTPEEIAERKRRLTERADAIDRTLHELELINPRLKANLNSVDWLAQRELKAAQRELMRARVRQAQDELAVNEARAAELRALLAAVRQQIRTAGGRGSAEDALRRELNAAYDAERALLAAARDPAQADAYRRIDAAISRIDAVATRNASFRDGLDASVEERLAGARAVLAAEREALATYDRVLADIDGRAALLRDAATAVALERVREELTRIVVRADVGIIDTAFGRKQQETDQISALQKGRAAELTDLTQAYADLTRDELP